MRPEVRIQQNNYICKRYNTFRWKQDINEEELKSILNKLSSRLEIEAAYYESQTVLCRMADTCPHTN